MAGLMDAINDKNSTTYTTLDLNKLNTLINNIYGNNNNYNHNRLVLSTGFIGSVIFNYTLAAKLIDYAPNIYTGIPKGKKHYGTIKVRPKRNITVYTLGKQGSLYKCIYNNKDAMFVYYRGTIEVYRSTEFTPKIVNYILTNK